MTKRIGAFLLALCMVLSIMPLTSAAGIFADVNQEDWFDSAVEYVFENNLMSGVGEGNFDPNGVVSRAMVWMTLARLDEANVIGGEPWYAKAQAWAIANGVSDGTDPEGNVTREQLISMLYRYAQAEKYDVSVGENTNILSYSDAFSISDYAFAAFQWGCGADIINGIDGALVPQGTATRAQLAVMLRAFVENVVKAEPEEVIPATHTVTFLWNFGDEGAYYTTTVKHGKAVERPESPEREDFGFMGWTTTDGELYDFSAPVMADLELYAKWSHIFGHICTFTNWESNDNGTHTGWCVCGQWRTYPCIIEDGVCVVCGEVYPATAEQLIEAIAQGGTVILSDDILLDEPLEIPEGVEVVLDLNGNTLETTQREDDPTKHYYAIDNYGTLILKNGTIKARGIENFGTMTVEEGVSITALDENGGAAIWNEGDLEINGGNFDTVDQDGVAPDACALYNDGGDVVINDGTFKDKTPRSYCIISEGGTMVINDGEFYGHHGVVASTGNSDVEINGGLFELVDDVVPQSDHTIYAASGGKVTINGGKVKHNGATESGGKILYEEAADEIKVTGGEFDADPTDCVANGYEVVENTDGTYSVVQSYSVDENGDVTVYTESGLANTLSGLTSGDEVDVVLAEDITTDGDTKITVPIGATVNLDLNGKTLATETDGTGNREAFLVKGEMNVSGGTITTEHTGTDLAWSAMTTVFDITAGGVLNLEGVTIKNLGGSAMAFCIHLNNWGEVTLNANNCVFESTYMAIRLFNSGYDDNNVTITNSTIHGDKYAVWVHNYIGDLNPVDHPNDAIKARIKLDIYDGSNTITAGSDKTSPTPVLYGFDTYVYFNANGEEVNSLGNLI